MHTVRQKSRSERTPRWRSPSTLARTAGACAAAVALVAAGASAVDAAAGDGPDQDIRLEVRMPTTGGLGISIAADGVQLDPPSRSADGERWQATGELPAVRVVDLRPTDAGWNVTAWPTDFDGPQAVGTAALGWTPRVLSVSDGQQVAAGAPTPAGGTGISTLASAPAGAGRGTATLGAELSVELPGDARPGTYRTTLCLTVI